MYLNIGEQNRIDWISRRQWLLLTISNMLDQNAEDRLLKSIMLSQKISQDTDLVEDTISILRTFFRDLLIFSHDPEKIVNLDFSDSFADINHKIVPKISFKWLTQVIETEKRLLSNTSLRLTMDRFFLKLCLE